MRLSRRTFVKLAALAVPLAACTRRAAHTGPARRIVSLGPNATEILFALGAGDRVVGVSRYDDYPPEVTRLPHVGGMLDPSFEAIVALRPDALVGAQGPANRAVLARLESLGVRTLFNILGPLTNPAGAPTQLMGVFHPDLVGIQIRVLQRLGARHAMTVYGLEGLDEISISGKTMIGELKEGRVEEYTVHPERFGLPLH
ncbi:MAG: ABC transporter substrate-binding protein, partial [Deltaproteobacteria bacterium]